MDKPEKPGKIPEVSVIIPAYNQALYLNEAIQSVLGQTDPDFELVVVDDGSTDETPELLAGIHDSRMCVIRQSNAGLSAARNAGLRASSAPLVTFLDADDYFLPDKLEVLSGYLGQHPEIGLVAGRMRYIDPSGNTILEPGGALTKLAFPELLLGNPICVSGVLLRRDWLDRVGTFDESLRACEDWDLWLRLLTAGCQMAWEEHLVVAYRLHPEQMTRQSERMRTAILSVFDKFFRQPELPDYLLAYIDKTHAAALVHAAAYAYYSGEFSRGQTDLVEAVRLDPTLKENNYQRLIGLLVAWSNDPRSTEPAFFLQRIIDNPPAGQPGLQRQLRRALADSILSSLFHGSPQVWRARRGELLKVIRYKPNWLLNRGVLRMFAVAWLHIG